MSGILAHKTGIYCRQCRCYKEKQCQKHRHRMQYQAGRPVQNQAQYQAHCQAQRQAQYQAQYQAQCQAQRQAQYQAQCQAQYQAQCQAQYQAQCQAQRSDLEYDQPWRPVTWSEDNKNQMLKELKDFQPGTAEVHELKILLHGPIGAGKSSLINSINTVLQGHNTAGALAASSAGQSQSFTLKFKTHRLKKDGPGSFYPFVFTDIMGLEEDKSDGVQTKDINKILKGHVKDGYTFNPVKPIDKGDPKYMSNPSLKDKVHCLVSVLPGDIISLISDDVIQKMRAVREKARDLEIPQVVVMSMVDKVCPLVKENLRKIYTSKKIKEKMEECSHKLGVPMNCIFPVQNYHEQVTNNMDMDLLILMAMTDIVTFANDYVEDQVYNANKYDEDKVCKE